jgi:hypothetical protein
MRVPTKNGPIVRSENRPNPTVPTKDLPMKDLTPAITAIMEANRIGKISQKLNAADISVLGITSGLGVPDPMKTRRIPDRELSKKYVPPSHLSTRTPYE